MSGFHPLLSVRLIKDIISPHKPSRAQEILEKGTSLSERQISTVLAAVGLHFKSNHRQRISLPLLPSPTCKISSATVSGLRLSALALPDSLPPRYRLSPQAATCPSTPKRWAARENQSKRRHRRGWGVSYTSSSQRYKTHGPVIKAGHTA